MQEWCATPRASRMYVGQHGGTADRQCRSAFLGICSQYAIFACRTHWWYCSMVLAVGSAGPAEQTHGDIYTGRYAPRNRQRGCECQWQAYHLVLSDINILLHGHIHRRLTCRWGQPLGVVTAAARSSALWNARTSMVSGGTCMVRQVWGLLARRDGRLVS